MSLPATKRLEYWTYAALAVLALAAAVAFFGCASKGPQTPQQVINEAKETVLAVKRLINQNLTDGFYTASQAERKLNEVEAVERQVKDAESLLKLGKGVEAGNRAAAARAAIRALRTQVERK